MTSPAPFTYTDVDCIVPHYNLGQIPEGFSIIWISVVCTSGIFFAENILICLLRQLHRKQLVTVGSDMVTLKINVFFVLPGFNALKKILTRVFTWADIILETKDLLPSLVLSVFLGFLCPANALIVLHTSCVMTISWVSWLPN